VIALALHLALSQLAHAAPLLSIDTVLDQPLAQRVSVLERLDHRRVADDLVRAAFDPARPLRRRWRAVTTMGKLDAREFRPALDRAGRAPEWFLRNAALIARLNDERDEAVAATVRALDDPALMVRTQAVRNLIHFDAHFTTPKLWRALADRRNFSPRGESLWIRAHIAEAIAHFARPGRAPELRRLLEDDDERLHRWGVRALERTYGLGSSGPNDSVSTARRQWLQRFGDDII
jgi:HEAT repeat protein